VNGNGFLFCLKISLNDFKPIDKYGENMVKKKKYPWFKLYPELIHDIKITRLNIFDRYIWFGLLCLAGESPIRGKLYITKDTPMTLSDIIISLSLTPASFNDVLVTAEGIENYLINTLQKFEEQNMIKIDENRVIEIINWMSRQGSDTPQSVQERVANFRAREKAKSEGVNVTYFVTPSLQCNESNVTHQADSNANIKEKKGVKRKCNGNVTEMKRIRDKSIEKEEELTHSHPSDENTPALPSRAGAREGEVLENFENKNPTKVGKKKIEEMSLHEQGAEIINILKKINPTLTFNRKVYHQAARDLINDVGVENAIILAKLAVESFGVPYFPIITTPIHLRDKCSQLISRIRQDTKKEVDGAKIGNLKEILNRNNFKKYENSSLR
jgi:hypothetical protein